MSNDRLKMWYGFCLTISLIVLAGVIALGKVSEATSYGLHDVLIAVAVLAGAWSQWAFGPARSVLDSEHTEPNTKSSPDSISAKVDV